MGLRTYWEKRDFKRTPEPRGKPAARRGWSYVIQKHDATRLHYDFRLELEGVLLSWAVPKGPSLDPDERRLAVQTEDHPVAYGKFEGTIPEGEYGGGPVIVWDRGHWRPRGDPREGLERGHLSFELEGEKLTGGWALIRMRGHYGGRDDDRNWLLVKARDEEARSGRSAEIVLLRPESVASGRLIEDVDPARSATWENGRIRAAARQTAVRKPAVRKPAARKPAVRKPAARPSRRRT